MPKGTCRNYLILTFIFLTAFSHTVFSQKIGLDELLYLQKKSFIEINDFLVGKGWEFSHSKQGDYDEYSVVFWALKKTFEGKAKGWFTLYYANSEQNIISYQIHNKDYYSEIKSKINAYKMKTIDSGIEENRIYSIHEGVNYIIKLTIESEEQNENTLYHVNIFHRETYESFQQNKFIEIYNNLLTELKLEEEREEKIEINRREEEKRNEQRIKDEQKNKELISQGYTKIQTGTILYDKDKKGVIQLLSQNLLLYCHKLNQIYFHQLNQG